MFQIFIVDDHPIVRAGLTQVINDDDELNVIASAVDGNDAIQIMNTLSSTPDLIIVDILMPNMNGIEFVKQIQTKAKIVILSTEIDVELALNLLKLGISGYVLKDESPDSIVNHLKKVLLNNDYVAMSNEVLTAIIKNGSQAENSYQITAKQRQILEMVADGLTNQEISKQIFVTDRTVKTYLTEIYSCLGVNNRAQAIAVAVRNNLI